MSVGLQIKAHMVLEHYEHKITHIHTFLSKLQSNISERRHKKGGSQLAHLRDFIFFLLDKITPNKDYESNKGG
jgi:hypothetical protein